MSYQGFRVSCGCTCPTCGRSVVLEGYSDADGNHYCRHCDDYVAVRGRCAQRKPELVQERKQTIERAGALDD